MRFGIQVVIFQKGQNLSLQKDAEFINANYRKFQVLRNLIIRKRAKIALINSALIYSRIGLEKVNKISRID